MIVKLNVPHIRQSHKTTCGATALAMVLNYWKIMDSEEVVWLSCKSQRPNSTDEYTTTKNLVNYSKRSHNFDVIHDTSSVALNSKIATLIDYLDQGLPIIVCQRVSRNSIWGHYRVVIGYDHNNFFVNDPLDDYPCKGISFKDFNKLWGRTIDNEVIGGEYFLILPKSKDSKLLT